MSKRAFIGVGHGGSDPGAVANGLKEAHINLVVALEVDAILKAHNVITQLSRYKEENDDLSEEIKEANAFKPDVAVDIHVNAGGGDGFEAFCSINGGLGRTLALNIESEVKAIGQNSRGVKTKMNGYGNDYFGFIRSVNCPSIIVEMAFIDNINDIKDFDEMHEQKKYALAVAKGILKTLGIAYKGTSTTPSVPSPTPTPSTPTNGYTVTITADVLNVRSGASTSYPVTTTVSKGQVYTIVAESNGWGKLKSGTGWVSLAYTSKGSTSTSTPVVSSCDKEEKRYSENGTCKITTPSGIRFRNKPCTCHGEVQGTYSQNETVNYDLVVITEKYVWISWVSASKGVRRYMPVKDRKKNERWGNCY